MEVGRGEGAMQATELLLGTSVLPLCLTLLGNWLHGGGLRNQGTGFGACEVIIPSPAQRLLAVWGCLARTCQPLPKGRGG